MSLTERLRVHAALATGVALLLLMLSAESAAASPALVRSNTNLRQGPGTNYGVVATVPGGSFVEISQCAAEWCTAHWRGRVGYMIASNLDPRAVRPPMVVYSGPTVVYGPSYGYYGPRYYLGPRYRYWRRW